MSSGASLLGPAHEQGLTVTLYRQCFEVAWLQLSVSPVCIFVVCWPLWSATHPLWLSCLEGRAPVVVYQQGEVWPGWSAELRRAGGRCHPSREGVSVSYGNRGEKSVKVKVPSLSAQSVTVQWLQINDDFHLFILKLTFSSLSLLSNCQKNTDILIRTDPVNGPKFKPCTITDYQICCSPTSLNIFVSQEKVMQVVWSHPGCGGSPGTG